MKKKLGGPYWMVNGVRIPQNSVARMLLSSAAFGRGDGIFEAMYARNGKIFHFEDHMDRLARSLKIRGYSFPYKGDRARVEKEIYDVSFLNSAFGFTEQMVYAYITPEADGLETLEGTEALAVIVKPHKASDPKLYQNGVEVLLLEYERGVPNVKSTARYADARMAYKHAKELGLSFYDVLFQDRDRRITEAAKHNVFAVKDGTLITPFSSRVLSGVTRKIILQLAVQLGIPAVESYVPYEEFIRVDEAFLTNTPNGVMPLRSLQPALFNEYGNLSMHLENVIGEGAVGPLTKRMMDAFSAYQEAYFRK